MVTFIFITAFEKYLVVSEQIITPCQSYFNRVATIILILTTITIVIGTYGIYNIVIGTVAHNVYNIIGRALLPLGSIVDIYWCKTFT